MNDTTTNDNNTNDTNNSINIHGRQAQDSRIGGGGALRAAPHNFPTAAGSARFCLLHCQGQWGP